MPVVAVKNGGKDVVILASNKAYLGIKQKSSIAYLVLFAGSLITAASVHSLPVPAVVGIAINTGNLCNTFKTPFILDKGVRFLTTRMPTPFAQSMLEPPPRAMIP